MKPLKIFDCHVHYGIFRDIDYPIESIVEFMNNLNVSEWCGMPIFTAEPFSLDKLKSDYEILLKLAPNSYKPILVIDPEMTNKLSEFVSSNNIPFIAAKIHPYIHRWKPFSMNFEKVINFVREQKLPLLIHTGGSISSEAGVFKETCKINNDIIFILCHGRPIEEALLILNETKKSNNVYIDISFMSIEEIQTIFSKNFSDNVLFGSDFPINVSFYPEIDPMTWYKKRTDELINCFGNEIFEIFNYNFKNVFLSKCHK